MDTVLKVERDGDLRRALLKGIPSFAAIDRAVEEIWPGCSADGAKYMDDEGDACTLKEKTFPDFLATARKGANGSVLRLLLSPACVPQAVAAKEVPSATQAFTRPWERVEQSSEPGEEQLHTVADLTDAQEEGEPGSSASEAPQEAAQIPQDSNVVHEGLAKEGPTQEGVEVPQAVPSLFDGVMGGTLVHSIDTPPTSPRGCAEPLAQDATLEDSTAATLHSEPMAADVPVQQELPGAAESQGHAASTSSGTQEGVIIDHDIEEKIDIVLAAFDENGDGHLNFSESSALHDAAWGSHLAPEVFQQMCTAEGEDPEVGLGRESLMCIYSSSRNVERDFEAAKEKLLATASTGYPRQQRDASANPINLMLKNPLLAVPFALDATERLRQGVASTLTRKR